MTGATLEHCDLRAIYDHTTKWPTGIKPEELGAVAVDTSDESGDRQSETNKGSLKRR